MDKASYKLGQVDMQIKVLAVAVTELIQHAEISDHTLKLVCQSVKDLEFKVESILQNSVEDSN
jgi:hypothetical protein